eukprot:scaffold51912_cov57-Phaeocystis_antarctica.AAC.3
MATEAWVFIRAVVPGQRCHVGGLLPRGLSRSGACEYHILTSSFGRISLQGKESPLTTLPRHEGALLHQTARRQHRARFRHATPRPTPTAEVDVAGRLVPARQLPAARPRPRVRRIASTARRGADCRLRAYTCTAPGARHIARGGSE